MVKKDGDTLVVQIPANEEAGTDKRNVRVPLMKVDQVVVYGEVTLTSSALLAILEQEADVCFLTFFGQFKGRLGNGMSRNVGLRIAQHRKSVVNEPSVALMVAKQFVRGKLANMRTMLQRANRQAEEAEVTVAIRQLGETISKVDKLVADHYPPPDPSRPQLNTAWGRLLGFEGSGSASYFGVLGLLLKHGWVFTKRVRRPPTDPINAMLSYGYTLLANQVASAVQVVGLDPFVGFLHGSKYSKPSLALDVMEEFRPIIVDSLVLTLVNKRIIQPDDFVETLGAFRLTDGARKRFLLHYEARLNETIKHPTFDYEVTYRRAIELQVRLLGKWLQDEIEHYPPFLVR